MGRDWRQLSLKTVYYNLPFSYNIPSKQNTLTLFPKCFLALQHQLENSDFIVWITPVCHEAPWVHFLICKVLQAKDAIYLCYKTWHRLATIYWQSSGLTFGLRAIFHPENLLRIRGGFMAGPVWNNFLSLLLENGTLPSLVSLFLMQPSTVQG